MKLSLTQTLSLAALLSGFSAHAEQAPSAAERLLSGFSIRIADLCQSLPSPRPDIDHRPGQRECTYSAQIFLASGDRSAIFPEARPLTSPQLIQAAAVQSLFSTFAYNDFSPSLQNALANRSIRLLRKLERELKGIGAELEIAQTPNFAEHPSLILLKEVLSSAGVGGPEKVLVLSVKAGDRHLILSLASDVND